MNERRAFRENQQVHFGIISKSIAQIVRYSNNAQFKCDVYNLLKVEMDQTKTVELEAMKCIKANYENKPKNKQTHGRNEAGTETRHQQDQHQHPNNISRKRTIYQMKRN